MMEIKERLALSARPGKLTLIREGMFLKCYQQSLFSLVIDFFNERGKLYTLRYNLPSDSPERTERRIALLLHLLRQDLAKTTTTAEVA